MTSIAGELFDNLPDQCPGCGAADTPAEDGPSKLMFLWVWQLGVYLCNTCNNSYGTWLGTNWTTELDKDGNTVSQADLHKPKCLQNIEAINREADPDYSSWRTGNVMNPMGAGYYSPPNP
jgi:hypothetical protein